MTEFTVSIGEPIVVPEVVQVVLDCGQFIEQFTSFEIKIASITWYKDGRESLKLLTLKEVPQQWLEQKAFTPVKYALLIKHVLIGELRTLDVCGE